MVTGPSDRVGIPIVEHAAVSALFFTGSVAAGRGVYTHASAPLKKVILELGGKNPQIVLDDADLSLAVEGALFGAFGTAGQRCTATSRLTLHEAIYDKMLELIVLRTRALKIGDPLDPKTDVGPVCGRSQKKKILNYSELGEKEGAMLITWGRAVSSVPGFFYVTVGLFPIRLQKGSRYIPKGVGTCSVSGLTFSNFLGSRCALTQAGSSLLFSSPGLYPQAFSPFI